MSEENQEEYTQGTQYYLGGRDDDNDASDGDHTANGYANGLYGDNGSDDNNGNDDNNENNRAYEVHGRYPDDDGEVDEEDNEVTIDFDSGTRSDVTIEDTYFAWDYYISSQSGTYAQDGFTLKWMTEDWWQGDSKNADNLGSAIYDTGNSNSDHSSENAQDYVFGVNYANGNNGYDDGFEYSTLWIKNDDGYNFSLKDLDIVDSGDESDAGNQVGVLSRTVLDTGFVESQNYAYTTDGEHWGYTAVTYDYDLGGYTWAMSESNTLEWEDIQDAELFNSMNMAYIDVNGDGSWAVDNIELEVLA